MVDRALRPGRLRRMTRAKNEQEQPSFLRIERKTALLRAFPVRQIRNRVNSGACGRRHFLGAVAVTSHSFFAGLDHATPEPHVAAMNTAACNIFFGFCREIICA